MDFNSLNNMYSWGMATLDEIKVFVPEVINAEQYKRITGVDYENKQTNTDSQQNNQGTTNQNTAQQ